MDKNISFIQTNNQSGAVAITVAIMMTMFLGFVALAVDTGHLVVTKNELQNAADAGALAGARELYNSDGTVIQVGANQIAYDSAVTNMSEKSAVEVNWTSGNTGDVLRGHWSFGQGSPGENDYYPRGFETKSSTTVLDPSNKYTAEQLNVDPDFINAVQVTARRESTPISSFFARIFGLEGFQQSATAVAYVGPAGRFVSDEFDIPIAICTEALGDPYNCKIGSFYEYNETIMWTNLSQKTHDDGTNCISADASNVKPLADGIDPDEKTILDTGIDMGVINGVVNSALDLLIDQWKNESKSKTELWTVKVPVIQCIDGGKEENTCAELLGGIIVDIVWIRSEESTKKAYGEIPTHYNYIDYDGNKQTFSTGLEGEARWDAFATALGLVDSNDDPLPLLKKTIYFKSSCQKAPPMGGPGGAYYGSLSQRPVLVN